MIRLLAKLGSLDGRWLYGLMVLALIVPLIFPVPIPTGGISPPTRAAFELLDSCPPDRVVVIDSSWDAGSASENRLQFETVVRHLCSRGTRFVITSIGITPFGPEFANSIAAPLAAEAGYVYGVDWVNLGYVAGPPGSVTRGALGVVIERCGRDFHAAFPTDWRGTRVAELPLMERVHSYRNVHAFGVITYQANEDWMSVVSGVFGGKFWIGCMSIAAPAFYQYLHSGQLNGMLAGTRGAAEYEHLLGRRGLAGKLGMAGAFGNCVVILAALVGNVGWWATRRLRREGR
jgi:hypothetical protein